MGPIAELERALREANTRLDRACKALAPVHKGGEEEEFDAALRELLAAERALAAARGEEHAVSIEFPVEWDTGAPIPCLLQRDNRTFVTFFLKEHDPNWDGTYVTVREPSDSQPQRIAVVEFKHCHSAKMGSPNDEVHNGHPLHGKGLDSYTAQEVVNSRWLAEIEAINSVHSCYKPEHWKDLHHYVLWFHDSTFECLAESFQVETYNKSLSEILSGICELLLD